MADDVLVNKAASIERAVARVRQVHVRVHRLGVPQHTREAFQMLEASGLTRPAPQMSTPGRPPARSSSDSCPACGRS